MLKIEDAVDESMLTQLLSVLQPTTPVWLTQQILVHTRDVDLALLAEVPADGLPALEQDLGCAPCCSRWHIYLYVYEYRDLCTEAALLGAFFGRYPSGLNGNGAMTSRSVRCGRNPVIEHVESAGCQ